MLLYTFVHTCTTVINFSSMCHPTVLHFWLSLHYYLAGQSTDIGKSAGPRSSTSENSGGSMKTLIVPALLSGKKSLLGAPLWGLLCWKNYIRSCKSFGGAVKLGFSMWLPVLLSGKGPKVFPMSGVENQNLIIRLQMQQTYWVGKSTGPRSSTCENSGGPMKTLIVSVLLSAKKFL